MKRSKVDKVQVFVIHEQLEAASANILQSPGGGQFLRHQPLDTATNMFLKEIVGDELEYLHKGKDWKKDLPTSQAPCLINARAIHHIWIGDDQDQVGLDYIVSVELRKSTRQVVPCGQLVGHGTPHVPWWPWPCIWLM